jgi:hypothetical protein
MTEFDGRKQDCLRSVYAPPTAASGWTLEKLLGHDRLRYFAYGRHALVAALRNCRVAPGDVVLLPAFICREVLSAVHTLDARAEYYPVDAGLRLACDPATLPMAKAIAAVDYFGFAQDLAPFREYATRSGATLIEDNAHGLFSCDSEGHMLGARGDLGIFSLRKTLVTPNGAALVVNGSIDEPLAPQLPFSRVAPDASFQTKQRLRRLARRFGAWPARAATTLTRLARRLRTGHAIPPSLPQSETQLPAGEAPHELFLQSMHNTDVVAESARRRGLYQLMPGLLDPARYPPLFPSMPPGTVPYGYPFIANTNNIAAARRILARHGLECLHWPALPDAVAKNAPLHYRSVWMVSFLW